MGLGRIFDDYWALRRHGLPDQGLATFGVYTDFSIWTMGLGGWRFPDVLGYNQRHDSALI